jgi:hypothetical protein
MTSDQPPVLNDVAPATTRWRPRESALRIGIAQIDITPPVGVRAHNWGASRTSIATGVHRPLTATALAISDGAGVHFVLSADLGWWGSTQSFRSVFDPVVAHLGAHPDDVLLHLIHTHAGPSLAETDTELEGADVLRAYRGALVDALSEVAERARADIAPATLTWQIGRCALAVNRDLPCGDRDVVGFNPAASADDTLVVGRIAGAKGEIRGTVLNYACHPTTLAFANTEISPDYIGAAREVVEAVTAAPMIFLQGASGDLAPRDQYGLGTEAADRNGRALGHAALSALESMPSPSAEIVFEGVVESGAPLGLWVERPVHAPDGVQRQRLDVAFPIREPMSAAELTEKWNGIDETAAVERSARARRLAEGYADEGVVRHPVWIWRWGDAVLVAHPGEAFSYLQTELRARHPERAVVVLNLTNGPGFVYLPTEEAYEHDRYQVWQTLMGPGALEELVDAIDDAIASLPPARKVTA